ncbi:MAG TPA: gliding motility lipoprotein GldH [Flavobacteriales bacterium]|nr:gliding motility lipoprotein GldH [Flavobacteriales bacterium]HIO73136.1 gliding motility lipoprotein GldH [Flavobacteriales bacterium]
MAHSMSYNTCKTGDSSLCTGLRNTRITSMNMTKYAYLLAFFVISLLCACDSSRIFEENKEIVNGVWNVNDTISFEVEIADSAAPVNMYLNVRNAGMYQYENLFMFITTTFPNGRTHKDTVECILADQNGWLGDGLGEIFDNQILFRRRVTFPLNGKYIFSLEQAHRFGDEPFIENLPFIIDVGMRIEYSK